MTCECSYPGIPPVLMARISVVRPNFTVGNAVQSDVSTITVSVVDTSDGSETYSETLNVSDVIYNTLQTGDIWTQDTIGFNFAHTPPGSSIPDDNRTYIAEYELTLQNGSSALVQFEIVTKKRYS